MNSDRKHEICISSSNIVIQNYTDCLRTFLSFSAFSYMYACSMAFSNNITKSKQTENVMDIKYIWPQMLNHLHLRLFAFFFRFLNRILYKLLANVKMHNAGQAYNSSLLSSQIKLCKTDGRKTWNDDMANSNTLLF